MRFRSQGTRVPDNLSSSTARCVVYRGVCYSYDSATSPEIIDLCGRLPQYPKSLRARNTRLIMRNVVPEGLEISRPSPIVCETWILLKRTLMPSCSEVSGYALSGWPAGLWHWFYMVSVSLPGQQADLP